MGVEGAYFLNFQRLAIVCPVLTALLNIEDIKVIVGLPEYLTETAERIFDWWG